MKSGNFGASGAVAGAVLGAQALKQTIEASRSFRIRNEY
jgi:hypothetical protein